MLRALAALLAIAIVGAAATSAGGANSTSVVSATVPSATTMSVAGCLPGVAGRTAFGLVPVATSVSTTDDCTVTFGSSNDTASLRMAQLDASGKALSAAPDRRQASWGVNGEAQVTGITGLAQGAGAAVVVQPDGKVVVAGRVSGSAVGWDEQSIVYRLRVDGTLDTTGFNSPNGYVSFNAAVGQDETFRTVALQSDGKIVAAGTARTGGSAMDATIARVNADGTPDLPFGGAGTALRVEDLGASSGGSDEGFRAILAEPDGTLLVGGTEDLTTGDDRWVLQKYLATGLPDPAVGAGTGRTFVNPTANHDELLSLVRDTRGGYLAGGQGQPSLFEGYVARISAGLTVDTTWGTSGFHRYGAGTRYPKALELESMADGSVLVAYEESSGTVSSAKIAKILPSGTGFDTTGFASPTGIAVLPITGSYGHVRSFEIDPSGRIYVLYQQFNDGALIARLTPAGVLDTTFANAGVTALDPNLSQVAWRGLFLQGNSLLFMSAHGSNSNDRLLRYGGPEIDDYVDAGAGTDRDWSSGLGNSMFGVCLREQLVATADWAVDPGNDCDVTDADEWRGIPALTTDPQSLVAHTTVAGQAATTRLRFGFRTSSNQAAGGYEAPVLFEVVAPS